MGEGGGEGANVSLNSCHALRLMEICKRGIMKS